MSKFEEELVAQVKADFKNRQEIRKALELNWRLNMNFVIGNQFSNISANGDIEESGKQYFWQEREVYNHIAPILETRLSKLARVKAHATVRPSSNDNDDVACASIATKLISAVCSENEFENMLSSANTWSEITGSAFYKIVWDKTKGKALDNNNQIHEGDVSISLCPPFEIFPENIAITDIEKQASIIHAKVLSTEEVKMTWNKDVKGENLNVFSFENANVVGGFGYSATVPKINTQIKQDSVLVIEKYEKPTSEFPNGRLLIVAGDTLLYSGDLPYLNGEDQTRTYPFARQVCIESLGSFFGCSVVERVIPVQRAYNVVKNRKHEFMNRIAMGILAVEDGSVDTDNLEEEGLSPGKILVYRQGSTPPVMLNAGQVPNEFSVEEEKLLNEFVMISGVSEVTTYSQVPSNIASGSAISLLLEQDDTRISLTADSLRSAVKNIGKHILRLYKQFAKMPRIKKISGENGEVEVASFSAGNINSEDIVFDTVNNIEDSLSARRAMVYDMLNYGLFTDDNGKINSRTKTKLFEILGFGNWQESRDIDEVHTKKALKENLELETKNVSADILDNHKIHIDEHTKLCVSNLACENSQIHQRISKHINEHKQFMTLDMNVSQLEKQMEEKNE